MIFKMMDIVLNNNIKEFHLTGLYVIQSKNVIYTQRFFVKNEIIDLSVEEGRIGCGTFLYTYFESLAIGNIFQVAGSTTGYLYTIHINGGQQTISYSNHMMPLIVGQKSCCTNI